MQADQIGDEWFIARHAGSELHADDGSQTTPIHTLTRSVKVQRTRYSFVSTSQSKEIRERPAQYAERRKDIDWSARPNLGVRAAPGRIYRHGRDREHMRPE